MAGYEATMTADDCWDLLARKEFARLAYHDGDRVDIAPINYALDRHRIVFKTAEGSKLAGVLQNPDVAFEADDLTDDAAMSVVVHGRAYELFGDEAAMTDQLRLRPWTVSVKDHVIAVDVKQITGRFFYLRKPWTSMTPH